MGSYRRLIIYIGIESQLIIKYLEPLTSDSFTTRFIDCHFDETLFPTLRGEIKQLDNYITWNALLLLNFDLRTAQYEQKFKRYFA
jgi:uncharacterized protein YozE (UPF0346 family)